MRGREERSQAGSVCLCTFRGSRTAFGAVHCGVLGPRIGPWKTHVFAAGEREVYDGKVSPSVSSPFRRSHYGSDITRQKYCDWSTIEYDVTWPDPRGPR